MGLHVSHDCWSDGYGTFGVFRRALASAIGVPLLLMEGFYGGTCTREIEKAVDRQPAHAGLIRTIPIRWDVLRPDPLYVLLNHPDNEGSIAPEDALPLAQRLEELAPALPDVHQEQAITFARGLRLAHELGQAVEFA